jgi:acetyl-CoA decarbonylase/synthase complex subunit gamma
MSFDCLRGSLSFRDAWILVLDTKGINVWCAAGKGTFGTNELVYRIAASGLKKSRRAPAHHSSAAGRAGRGRAHGQTPLRLPGPLRPVRAADLPAYLDAGLSAGREMRKVSFGLWDRAVLIPVELAGAAKYFFLASLAALLLAVFLGPAGLAANLFHDGLFAVAALGAGLLAGAVLHPLLLPWLPGAPFHKREQPPG